MLYPHHQDKELTRELFANPSSEYRGAPFWAWNGTLDKDELLRQIEVFKEMGLGGFHMHVRSGMATKYLSDEFMDLVAACRDKAEAEKMLCWLYDEDRWPSGAAGGYVTKDVRYRSRHLLFTPVPYGSGEIDGYTNSCAYGTRQENGKLLAVYDITLDAEGFLADYKQVDSENPKGGNLWYAYLEISGESPWYNNQTYLNTLDPKAVQRFVEVTHERYKERIGESFGGVVPAIFTDEPQFSHKKTLGFAHAKEDVTLPFTDDLCDTFRAAYGEDLLAHLPELFWDLPDGKVSLIRYHYHDHIAERFAQAFADTIGTWCKKNNIMLTGHMMEEPTLQSQTAALGEAMRSYRSFQLPGIDMLCDHREFTTAKQAQSAAHQFGYPGVLSELYGVTNWDFDFRGHKMQGDWQAALGVSVRVQHLSWYAMGGEAKRDYPASISYQSPWYKEYGYVENYFGRVNAALTRGKPDIKVGVIHPVESYWLHWGPREQTAAVREAMDDAFKNMAEWLLFGLIDYNYISESLLPIQCEKATAPFNVGQMRYDAVIVPGCETLRSTTVERLEAFQAAGGKLIFAGDIPTLVDAIPSDRVKKLAEKSMCVPMTKIDILNALETERELDIRDASGARAKQLLHQFRNDGEDKWLFVCHAYGPENPDVTQPMKYELRIKGEWKAEKWDAMNGEVSALKAEFKNGTTYIEYTMDAHDSLLLKLMPGAAEKGCCCGCNKAEMQEVRAQRPVKITLSEDNCLLLDQAEYALDDGEWQASDELLRADNWARGILGWPMREDQFAQPWVTAGIDYGDGKHTFRIRFTIDSRVAVKGAKLALEDAEYATIAFDGKPVDATITGWYVDKAIDTVNLPDFEAGLHTLEVDYDYKRQVNIEWCYLLGDFGVVVTGDRAYITEPVRELYYGDWTRQGLPFYGGNVTYHIPVEAGENGLDVEAPQYRGALIKAGLDGKPAGAIIYAPYRLHIEAAPGAHELSLTVFGNRANSFTALHNCDDKCSWFGPNAWRTTGKRWSYEYRLRPTGLLVAPRLFK